MMTASGAKFEFFNKDGTMKSLRVNIHHVAAMRQHSPRSRYASTWCF